MFINNNCNSFCDLQRFIAYKKYANFLHITGLYEYLTDYMQFLCIFISLIVV